MTGGGDAGSAVSDGVSSSARNGRGRRWSDTEKAAIVVESLEPGVVVTALARRLGIRPEQIHGWRKDARRGRLTTPAEAIDPVDRWQAEKAAAAARTRSRQVTLPAALVAAMAEPCESKWVYSGTKAPVPVFLSRKAGASP